jgi:hypothetical protein
LFVLSRVAKPLFGLTVLLACPWLGLGSSARACFVLGQFASPLERAKLSGDLALVVPLDAEETGSGGASSGGMGDEDRRSNEGSPGPANLPRQVSPAWRFPTGSVAGGTSSSGPTPGAGAAGLVGILTLAARPLGVDGADRLFLRDERFKPPPFASRLFRPPRES